MSMSNSIIVSAKNFEEHVKAASDSRGLSKLTAMAAEKIIASLNSGGKVMVCGNGGSASDSNHFAAELVNKYLLERKPLAAISLTSNPSNLTSIGNDYGFDFVFSKQVEAIGRQGDVLVAIRTSGKSRNIFEAIKSA